MIGGEKWRKMEEKEFIAKYVIQYVADKMARVNRNEVQSAELVNNFGITALREGKKLYDFWHSQQQVI